MTQSRVRCIDCEHFNLRSNKAMAEQGYGTCGLDHRPGRFQSAIFDRTCSGFTPVKPDVAQRRRQWLADRDAEFQKSILGVTA